MGLTKLERLSLATASQALRDLKQKTAAGRADAIDKLANLECILVVSNQLEQSQNVGTGMVLLQSVECPVAGMLVQSQRQILQNAGYDQRRGVLHVKGTATTADVINSKRELYPIQVWQSQLGRLKHLITQGKLVGESGHPTSNRTSLDHTCVKYTNLWLDGNELKFTAEVLPTAPGKTLQTLIENGVAVDVSSRGRGKTKLGEWQGTKDVAVVQAGFECDGFDFVVAGASPSGVHEWSQA